MFSSTLSVRVVKLFRSRFVWWEECVKEWVERWVERGWKKRETQSDRSDGVRPLVSLSCSSSLVDEWLTGLVGLHWIEWRDARLDWYDMIWYDRVRSWLPLTVAPTEQTKNWTKNQTPSTIVNTYACDYSYFTRHGGGVHLPLLCRWTSPSWWVGLDCRPQLDRSEVKRREEMRWDEMS